MQHLNLVGQEWFRNTICRFPTPLWPSDSIKVTQTGMEMLRKNLMEVFNMWSFKTPWRPEKRHCQKILPLPCKHLWLYCQLIFHTCQSNWTRKWKWHLQRPRLQASFLITVEGNVNHDKEEILTTMKWWCEKLHGSTNAFQSFPVIKPTQIHVGHVEHIHHQSHHDFLGSHPDPDPCFCWWCWCLACLFALGSPAEKIKSLIKIKILSIETLQNIFISNTTKHFHSNAPWLSDLIITTTLPMLLPKLIAFWSTASITESHSASHTILDFLNYSQLRLTAILAPKHLKSFCAA